MQVLEYKGQKVITTELLAQVYKTDINNIRNNFKNHAKNFQNGLHYFYLEGQELREFKNYVNDVDVVGKRAPHLYLWTARGANRHCKILDTDKAWEQFDNLEETYFRVKEQRVLDVPQPCHAKYLNGIANFLRVQRSIMKEQGCTAFEVAQMNKVVCDSHGIQLPECVIKPNTYEQLSMAALSEQLFLDNKKEQSTTAK